MTTTHSQKLKRVVRWALIPAFFICVLAGLYTWASQPRAREGKLIDQKLHALRAAGEPIDSAALAKMFPPPPPELEAAELLKEALAFTMANPAPGNIPILTGGPELDHVQAIDPESMARLRRHYESTTNLVHLMPVLPAGARFGENWSNGVWTAPISVPFVKVRTTIQMLCARALYAAEAGDAEGATEMLERGFSFTAALPTDSTLVNHMIHEVCLGIVCRITERSLNKVSLSESQLQRMLQSMPSPSTNHLLGTFRVEHCGAIWLFQQFHAGKDVTPLLASTLVVSSWQRAWERIWPFRNQYNDRDFLTYLDFVPQMIATVSRPAPRVMVESETLFDQLGSNVTCNVAKTIAPNWRRSMEMHYRTETQLEVTRAALSIERFRVAHRHLPQSLDELVPAFLPSKPLDPFMGDGPLKFMSKNRGYVIYSIGSDGIDQGGISRTNQYSRSNYDITVTVER